MHASPCYEVIVGRVFFDAHRSKPNASKKAHEEQEREEEGNFIGKPEHPIHSVPSESKPSLQFHPCPQGK